MPITVLSKKSITFPKLRWSAEKGETKELPEDKEAQKEILASPHIQLLVETKDIQNSGKEDKTVSKSEEKRKEIQSGEKEKEELKTQIKDKNYKK